MSKSKTQYETRIFRRRNGEISVGMRAEGCDFTRENESRTGLTPRSPAEADKICRELTEQFRAAGDRGVRVVDI